MIRRWNGTGPDVVHHSTVAPVVTRRGEHVDDDRSLGPDADLVRDVARDRPGVARLQLTGLVADAELERTGQAHAELLGLVTVLRDDAVRIELDHPERDALALDDADVHALPDALQVERGDAVERAHLSSLQQPVAHPPDVQDDRSRSGGRQLAPQA